MIRRSAFTLIELLIAMVVTVLAAGAVAGTLRAMSEAMREQDIADDAMGRLARADARIADHLERARAILHQDEDEVLLWLPSEPFDASAANTTDYDTIHSNELAWYVLDAETGTLQLWIAADRSSRASHGLSTDWDSLRTTLESQATLRHITVLSGLAEGAFLVEDSDACSVGRFTLAALMDEAHGGITVRLGGRLANAQRHPDCQ